MRKKVKLRKDEGGYAFVLVLILLILIGLIIGPLLLLMTTTLKSSHYHEEWMLSFYAADAGIEDAAYKIRHDDPNLPDIGVPYIYFIEDEYGEVLEINDSDVEVTIDRIEDPDDEVYKITSIATSGGGSTTVESYVKADRVDLSGFGDNAITTNGEVTIMPGSEVEGDIEYDPDYWPTAEQLAAYFWEDVEDETPFASGTIDVDDYSSIGPLYRDGSLDIFSSQEDVTLTLTGTVYVTGDLDIGKTNQDFTLDLSGQSIFVEGEIDIGGKCTITGSGCIIAVGDVFFLPNISSEEGDFVFLMSVEGTVTFQPNGDYYGSVAGDVEVTLQPGSSLTFVDPEGSGFEFPSGGIAELDIRTYTIL